MPTTLRQVLRVLSVVFAVALGAERPVAQPALMVYDWHLGLAPAAAVEHLRGLGFSGLVTRVKDPADVTKLADYAGHVAGLDDFRLMAYVAYDFSDPQSPGVWRDALPILAEVGAPLWVVVKQAPSDLAIQQLLLEMARSADAVGLRAVVYPHWNTSVETADEAAALIAAVGHPNLRNSLHTCHEIRGGHQDELPSVVAAHADDTALVAIAGAKKDAYAGKTVKTTQDGYGLIRSRKDNVPKVGSKAPDFKLKTADGKKTVKLSGFRGKKPVVLVFGSFT